PSTPPPPHTTPPTISYTTLFRSPRPTKGQHHPLLTSLHATPARFCARPCRAPNSRMIHAGDSHTDFPEGSSGYSEHGRGVRRNRSEEHTSNSSHVAISYAVFCLK